MTFRKILERAKEMGYKFYYDGSIIETDIDEILENWDGLDGREDYALCNVAEKEADIFLEEEISDRHIGSVAMSKPKHEYFVR